VNTVNVCFIANENSPKVTHTLVECELSIDELGEAFKKLFNNYGLLKKYLKMKKENENFQNQLVVILKEK